MYKYFNLLSNAQIEFICNEFGISAEKLFSMNEKESNDLYDELGLIEADEIVIADEGSLSPRGKMATGIVNVLGNALAKDEGWI